MSISSATRLHHHRHHQDPVGQMSSLEGKGAGAVGDNIRGVLFGVSGGGWRVIENNIYFDDDCVFR